MSVLVPEALESRRLFAVDISLSAGLLRVEAAPGPDDKEQSLDVYISRDDQIDNQGNVTPIIVVRDNGIVEFYTPATNVSRIEVLGSDLDDRIRIQESLNIPSILEGEDGRDLLSGGAAADLILGGDGPDEIYGFGGDDVLYGGGDDDLIDGGLGADFMSGGSGTSLEPPSPYYQYPATAGDTVTYGNRTDPTRSVHVTLDDRANDGYAGEGDFIRGDVERVIGSAGNDVMSARLTGGEIRMLCGNGGDDLLLSNGDGVAYLVGETPIDLIDSVDGGLVGTIGNDTLIASSPGQFNSDFIWNPGPGDVPRNPLITIFGGGDDVIFGRATDNRMEGVYRYFGGAGDDRIRVISSRLTRQIVVGGGNGDDDIRVFGSARGYLLGNGGDDYIRGPNGDSDLFGNAGNDRIYGGSGDDDIEGGGGNDIISGGRGADNLYGDYPPNVIGGSPPGNDLIFARDKNWNDYIDGGDGLYDQAVVDRDIFGNVRDTVIDVEDIR